MPYQLPTFELLLKTLQQIPYLASKNVYKVADYFLTMDKNKIEHVCAVLLSLQHKLDRCSICCAWKEKAAGCLLCTDQKRDQTTLCVVESWHELLVIDKTQGYNGSFHVLNGVINPLEGIGPDDLSIDALVCRVELGNIKEIILATNQTPEGEATAAFIARKLKDKQVKITCLARGLPVGSSLEAMDRLTVYKALSERRLF